MTQVYFFHFILYLELTLSCKNVKLNYKHTSLVNLCVNLKHFAAALERLSSLISSELCPTEKI